MAGNEAYRFLEIQISKVNETYEYTCTSSRFLTPSWFGGKHYHNYSKGVGFWLTRTSVSQLKVDGDPKCQIVLYN